MASFGREFSRGLARTGPAAAQQAMLLTLRQVLEDPKTQAEREMAERRFAMDQDENRLRMDLLREQLGNARADKEFEARERGRAEAPEAIERKRRGDEAEIRSKEALADQRIAAKERLEKQMEAFEKDPEMAPVLAAARNADQVRYAASVEEAGAALYGIMRGYKQAKQKAEGGPSAPKATPGVRGKGSPAGQNNNGGKVKMVAPNGDEFFVPSDKVAVAEGRGAKRVK